MCLSRSPLQCKMTQPHDCASTSPSPQTPPLPHLHADHEPPAALWDVHGCQHCAQAVWVCLELAQCGGAAILWLDCVGHLEAAGQVGDEGRLAQARLTWGEGGECLGGRGGRGGGGGNEREEEGRRGGGGDGGSRQQQGVSGGDRGMRVTVLRSWRIAARLGDQCKLMQLVCTYVWTSGS